MDDRNLRYIGNVLEKPLTMILRKRSCNLISKKHEAIIKLKNL